MLEGTVIMSLEIKEIGNLVVLSLSGSLDRDELDQAKRDLAQYMTDPSRILVLDFTEIEYLSSIGIGFLLSLYGEAKSRDIDLKVVYPQLESARLLFNVTQLDRFISFVDNLDELEGS
jgi:anti-anti-sigma factor